MIDLSLIFTKKRIWITFITVLLVGIILEIWVSNRLATYGDQITQIETAKSSLTLQNELLRDEIAQKQSLQTAEKYAKALGFEDNSKISYLKNPNLALNSQ